MFAKAQSPMEERMVRVSFRPPQTGMIIHWWRTEENYFLTMNEVYDDMRMNERDYDRPITRRDA